jgi:hypothetical protein
VTPIVPQFLVEIIWSLLVLAYGVRVERYYVSWWSATFNLASFFVILLTVQLPLEGYALLLAYSALGFLVVHYNARKLFPLLGSKTYGSLALALGLNSIGLLAGLRDWAVTNLNQWFGTETGTIALAWVILTVISHVLGFFLARRRIPREKEF